MAALPGNHIMRGLYGFWGFTTILLFWAALIKATRVWGGINFQGKAYGWLEGGRGLIAALLGTFSLILFTNIMPDDGAQIISLHRIRAFRAVILSTSIFTVICGFIAWFLISGGNINNKSHRIKTNEILKLLKNPSIWLLAIIIICAYSGYKITDDFSLYAKEVLGFNEVKSAGVGTAALWMRAIIAILLGFWADKQNIIKLIIIAFTLCALGGLLMGLGIVSQYILPALLNLTMIMIGVYAVRALYFVLINEAGIPVNYTGTVVGLVSVFGFTPDVFMSPWMGFMLDRNPGITGHKHVFLVLSLFSLTGFIMSILFFLRNNLATTEQ